MTESKIFQACTHKHKQIFWCTYVNLFPICEGSLSPGILLLSVILCVCNTYSDKLRAPSHILCLVLPCTIEQKKVCFLIITYIKRNTYSISNYLNLCVADVAWCNSCYTVIFINKLYITIFRKSQRGNLEQSVSITFVPRKILEQMLF